MSIQDSGSYYCTADNGLGKNDKKELVLDVQYAPQVIFFIVFSLTYVNKFLLKNLSKNSSKNSFMLSKYFVESMNFHYLYPDRCVFIKRTKI